MAKSVPKQLRFLDPDSSLVAAVDLRLGAANRKRLKDLVSRGLREYRRQEPDSDGDVPEDADGALEEAARSAHLSKDELEGLLDGYAVIGLRLIPNQGNSDVAEPQVRAVAAFRTAGDGLEGALKKAGARLRPFAGHPDAKLIDSSTALVGDDTLVYAEGDDEEGSYDDRPGRDLRAALDRREGFAPDRLVTAQRRTRASDPLVLATGDLDLGGAVVGAGPLRRARSELPLLRAFRGAAAALELRDDGVHGTVRVALDSRELGPSDLPVGPPGAVKVPDRDDAAVGGSRNQSTTTAFGLKLARALFSDSRFVRAVDATERKLHIDFEREFLSQFDCPSVSVLEGADGRRFAARSCVRDPARMRALLPRLTPELPKILTSLQALDNEGLAGLLLVAPDAPLTPSFGKLLGAVSLHPLKSGGGEREQLYELRGLRDPSSRVAYTGPDRVVFGMIGDRFVVASNRERAEAVAKVRTEAAPRRAASVTRVPARLVLGGGDVEGRLASRLFDALTLSASADGPGLAFDAELPYAGD